VSHKAETQLTVDERVKLQREDDAIMSKDLSDDVRDAMLKNVSQKYRTSSDILQIPQNLFFFLLSKGSTYGWKCYAQDADWHTGFRELD